MNKGGYLLAVKDFLFLEGQKKIFLPSWQGQKNLCRYNKKTGSTKSGLQVKKILNSTTFIKTF